MQRSRSAFISGIIANAIDHYDVAIYSLLVPFLAPLFFPNEDKIVAIILAYGLNSLGIIARPLGALVFGRMAINLGARHTLVLVLIGMTGTTSVLGLIPTYEFLGPWAAIFLALLRMLQSLFAAGESAIAALYFLSLCDQRNLGRDSSYFAFSTMIGVGLASLVATWIHLTQPGSQYWRLAFLLSGLMAFPVLILRWSTLAIDKDLKSSIPTSFSVVVSEWRNLFVVVLLSSLSYVTYAIPFVFMNSFVPHILPEISQVEMLHCNNYLIIFDALLLLFFGIIADRFSYYRWMAFWATLLAITIVPLFCYLLYASLGGVILIRVFIVIVGVAFTVPLKPLFYQLFTSNTKYLITGFGYALGSELIGRSTPVVCWSLFYYLESPQAPALYVVVISLTVAIVLSIFCKRTHQVT